MAQCAVLITEGKYGVPLRFPRPALALIATGTAVVTIGVAGMPVAHADQIRRQEWWLRALGVTAAWDTSRGAGVTVAVLSDGVQARYADLAGAFTAAPAPAGAPVASGQYFGEQGTPIASLIAGRGQGSGILGVAPAARILSIPVTLPADDPELGLASTAAAIPNAIAAGIRYAVGHGASVIDLPIDPSQPGSSGTGGAPAAAGGSRAEQSAVNYALAHDVVLVAPAGDDGTSSDAPNYPAAYRGVVAVGAFDSAFIKAPWSSHRSYVTVTAAGAGVVAAASTGGYQTVNTTSAASAIVAGIAALIRAQYPGLPASQVRQAITSSTVYHPAEGRADGSGYGTVNAQNAITAAAALATPPGARAGAGAQPLVAPRAIPAASATAGIGSQLLQAGEVSAGLLAVLLLLIGGYTVAARRRRPATSPPAVTPQWTHRQGQSRYPQAAAAAADEDRMLEVFTSPLYQPDQPGPGGPADRSYTPRAGTSRAGTADGLFATAAGRQAGGTAAGHASTPTATPESGGLLSHGPATRAVSRRPVVSGSPPWEPASAPDTELPWTATAGRHAIGGTPPPAALPGGRPNQPDGKNVRAESSQSLFRPDDQTASQAGPHQLGWPLPQPADNQAPATWNSPAGSTPAGRGAWAGQGDIGRDAARWHPAPAAGPVIEGSVLNSSSRQPGQYQPSQYPEPDAHGRQPWSDIPVSGSRPQSAGGMSAHQPEMGPAPAGPRAGLPVRTPRPASAAPMSPSGSLWEPAGSEPGTSPGDGGDAGGRPIYVWNPAAGPSAPGYPPARLPEVPRD